VGRVVTVTEPKKTSRSRVHRGRKTEALLAEHWQDIALYPYAQPVGPGRSGRDILLTPGLFVEVKARGTVSLTSQLAKAADTSLRSRAQSDNYEDSPDIPVVVWRHNGQGPAAIRNWTVTMNLADFDDLMLMREDYRRLRAMMSAQQMNGWGER
jgi:hypothetical protein